MKDEGWTVILHPSEVPDWIIHMGAAHLAARPRRLWDVRWLLLGAVLPDAIPRVAGSAIAVLPFLDALGTAPWMVYLSFLHTPAVVAGLTLGLTVLAAAKGKAAASLAFGAATHFALDLLQKTWGGGTCLWFPLLLDSHSFQVLWYDNPWTKAVVAACGLYLLAIGCRRASWPREPALAPWCPRRGALGLGLLGLSVLLPILAIQSGIAANVSGSRLPAEPDAFEGRTVELPMARVDLVDAQWAHLDVGNVLFRVARERIPGVVEGMSVSVRGTFRGGVIEVDEVMEHDRAFKRIVSLLGGVLLALVWLPTLGRWWRRRRA